MESVELKSHILKLVESIRNEQLLQSLYDFLKTRERDQEGSIWSFLSEEEKKEVLLAYDESEDETNLVSYEQVFRKKK